MEINGTTYKDETNSVVVIALEAARTQGARVRLWYGDVATGRAWNEVHDTVGYIRRSMGPVKVPILLHSPQSSGGGAILDHCIVRIDTSTPLGPRRNTYQHPRFSLGSWRLVDTSVHCDGELFSKHETYAQAERLRRFMTGARFTP